MGIWILILTMSTGIATAEFDSKKACMKASMKIKKNVCFIGDVCRFICVEKVEAK